MDALERKLQILKMIPRFPHKIDVATIVEKLENLNCNVDKRTVQRDLVSLSGPSFAITCDHKKPNGWSWALDAEPFDLPRMDPVSAFTFRMTEKFLSLLIPPATFRSLIPHFKQASTVLNKVSCGNFQKWSDKIGIISRTQSLAHPNIDNQVMETVYECLLEGKRFSAFYRRRGQSEAEEFQVNPLGIVLLDSLIYLVCTLRGNDQIENIRQISLHRIISAEKLEANGVIPEGFNLQKYIDSGAFGYPQSEEKIRLKAAFDKTVAQHLFETPLSDDQIITDNNSDTVFVEASVHDTAQLRWWLLGFGDKVEVIEPLSLREEFREKVEKMYTCYSKRQ